MVAANPRRGYDERLGDTQSFYEIRQYEVIELMTINSTNIIRSMNILMDINNGSYRVITTVKK